MHAIPTAEELGITRIIVPRFPGNFSALGVAASDIKHDAVRTHLARLDPETLDRVRALVRRAARRRRPQLEQDGFAPRRHALGPRPRPPLRRARPSS